MRDVHISLQHVLLGLFLYSANGQIRPTEKNNILGSNAHPLHQIVYTLCTYVFISVSETVFSLYEYEMVFAFSKSSN